MSSSSSTRRPFFRNGIIQLNQRGEHALFDVKMKKKSVDGERSPVVSTHDIPPLPFGVEDVLRVTFFFENAGCSAPKRHKIAEGSISGSQLEGVQIGGSDVVISHGDAEWTFGVQEGPSEGSSSGGKREALLYIKSVSMQVSAARAQELPSALVS